MATKGIGFFNVKTGETNYAKSAAQIQAYINSSDMGVNASRGQDFGWKLEPEWVKKVRDFRRNPEKMERLVAKNGGDNPSTQQILYAIYGEIVRREAQRKDDHATPFADQYQREIMDEEKKPAKAKSADKEVSSK